ncbi:rifin PIR protein, putative [Plasmodium reichenowi]|uniref:Rifin PIR protein, putative n=1 Tax=Plasmodium reichenowi TaxID=5854 RepID=A0A2P9D409_PLARE|nr:rifin PIR protein, putative [Plasmodium reichenowi]
MKAHYINILLFALPLNILLLSSQVSSAHKNPSITNHTYTNRSLCECETYAPANYDNDTEMKKVMEKFDRQTSQRLREYDDRMVEKRKQCKERCDKEIQKIILKDKLEKQMEQQLTTLEAKIDTEDIPTCICEKSIADKMEKGCLRCGYELGTVAPTVGLIGSVAVHVWKPTILKATIAAAIKANSATIADAAQAAGLKEGMRVVTAGLEALDLKKLGIVEFDSFFIEGFKIDISNVANIISGKRNAACGLNGTLGRATCDEIEIKLGSLLPDGQSGPPVNFAVKPKLEGILEQATQGAEAEVAATKAGMEATVKSVQEKIIEAASYDWYATVGYSVLAIIIIILIMVLIYLILRYRRKKKMKKKLQYIKLLEE